MISVTKLVIPGDLVEGWDSESDPAMTADQWQEVVETIRVKTRIHYRAPKAGKGQTFKVTACGYPLTPLRKTMISSVLSEWTKGKDLLPIDIKFNEKKTYEKGTVIAVVKMDAKEEEQEPQTLFGD